MASQLAALPIPSPASGFTYTFDTATLTFKRSTQSFGPILADRAETIGKGKFSFGLDYQQFTFDSIEGTDLSRIPAVFTHDDYQAGGGRADVVTTRNSIEASVAQVIPFITYGISNRLDVSLAVPIVRAHLGVVSEATIQRIGTADDLLVHYFAEPNAPNGIGSQRQFVAEGTASGLGDLVVRLKGSAVKHRFLGVALGADFRAPTGDEKNLLGCGAPGVKPFLALSMVWKRISPHLNVAYQWNGKSELAGDVKTGARADFPDQFLYAAGVDVGVNRRMSLALDFLGQEIIKSPRLYFRSFTAAGPTATQTFPDIGFRSDSFTQYNGSAGMKVNLTGNMLVIFNMAFKLNDQGLRAKATPLIGLEFSF